MIVPIEITTIGAKVRWAVERSPGVMPTANFVEIPGVAVAPAFDMAPETIDVSDLSDSFTQYVPGRQDSGGDAEFELNHSDVAISAWEELCRIATSALAHRKRCWFEYSYPNAARSYYFCARPLPLGNGGMEQNAADTIPAHVIPYGEFAWYDKSTHTGVLYYVGADNRYYIDRNSQFYAEIDD